MGRILTLDRKAEQGYTWLISMRSKDLRIAILRFAGGVAFLVVFLIAGQAWGAGTPGQEAAPSAMAQEQPKPVAEGYVTALSPPDRFTINGIFHATTVPATTYKWFGSKEVENTPASSTDLQIGVWVKVIGEHDQRAKSVTAQTVLFRDDGDRKLTGLGVIEKVISTAPELVFAADGYRIRVTPATEVKFPHDVKSAADVHAGLWVLYEGNLGKDGLLVASKVRFVSTNHAKSKSEKAPGDSTEPPATPQPPANGNLAAKDNVQPPSNASGQTEDEIEVGGTEVQIGDSTYKISKDQALQSRVRRIGMSLVPVYQKQLPADDPSRIRLIFVAVDDSAREEHTSSDAEGFILVPAQLAARFKNDDQLAAVLADSIAYSLQQQAPIVLQMNRANLEWAGAMAATSLVPYAGLVTGSVYQHEINKALKEQRWRVALELMADAGYDPWQSPEAWRLAEPRKLPADTSTLKYPDRSGYQFSILNLMYAHNSAAKPGSNGTQTNPPQTK